jgi:hypothetical protein
MRAVGQGVPQSIREQFVGQGRFTDSVETGIAEFNDAGYARMAALEVRSFYFQAWHALILWVLRNYFPGMKKLVRSHRHGLAVCRGHGDLAAIGDGRQ